MEPTIFHDPFGEPGIHCPQCGAELRHRYGLAGGGMGAYTYCTNDACDYFVKQREDIYQDGDGRDSVNIPGDFEE